MITPHKLFGLLFLICCAAMGTALILQYGFDQHPCDLCLMQRFALMGIGITALLAWLFHPKKWGIQVFAAFCLAWSMAGLAASSRQVYLQSLPDELKPSCGPGLFFRLHHSPVMDALANAMRGTGDCAKVDWTFLGMSLAFWTGGLFVGLIVLSLAALLKIKKVVR